MKKNIAILFGGKSAEHDISVLTAKQVLNNLDRALYNIFPIYREQILLYLAYQLRQTKAHA